MSHHDYYCKFSYHESDGLEMKEGKHHKGTFLSHAGYFILFICFEWCFKQKSDNCNNACLTAKSFGGDLAFSRQGYNSDDLKNIFSKHSIFLNRIQNLHCERPRAVYPAGKNLCCVSNDGIAWWRHQMEAFSALLAPCAVTGEFPITKASDTELWYFLWATPEQTAEQIIDAPVVWDAMALVMTSL